MNKDFKQASRGRQRLYASSSEKLGAFRERNKDAGFLRKEVLVHEDTANRLAEIAKTEGTSITNTASGLLELGLAHYEAMTSRGILEAAHLTRSSGIAELSSSQADAQGANGNLERTPTRASSLSSSALCSFGASPNSGASPPQDSLAVLAASLSSNASPEAEVVNPIVKFFNKRRVSTK